MSFATGHIVINLNNDSQQPEELSDNLKSLADSSIRRICLGSNGSPPLKRRAVDCWDVEFMNPGHLHG